MIFCYNASNKYTRVYINASNLVNAIASQNDAWERIKEHYFSMDGFDFDYWDSPEEEQAERDQWFEQWEDEAYWSGGMIMVDSHY